MSNKTMTIFDTVITIRVRVKMKARDGDEEHEINLGAEEEIVIPTEGGYDTATLTGAIEDAIEYKRARLAIRGAVIKATE